MAGIENQYYGLNNFPKENFPLQYHTPEQFDSYENLSDLNSNLNEINYQRQYEEPDPSYFNSSTPVNKQPQILNPPPFMSNNNNNNNNSFPRQDSYNNNSYITHEKPNYVPYPEPNSGPQYAANNNNSYPDLTGYATFQIPNLVNDNSNLESTPIQINQPNFIKLGANFQANQVPQAPPIQPAAPQPHCQHKAGIPFIVQETCFNPNKIFNKLSPMAFGSIPQTNNLNFAYGLNSNGLNNFSNLFSKLAMNNNHNHHFHHNHRHHHHPQNFAFNNGFNALAGLKRLGNYQMLNGNLNAFGNFGLARNGFGFNAGFNKLLNSSLNTFGTRLIY